MIAPPEIRQAKATPWREAVTVAPRKALGPRNRASVWMAWDGLCARCGGNLPLVEAEWDHRLALINGGDNGLLNWQPLHPACHKAKTRIDAKLAAKIKRIIRRLDGTRRARKAIASRGFNRSLRRKFNGKVESR